MLLVCLSFSHIKRREHYGNWTLSFNTTSKYTNQWSEKNRFLYNNNKQATKGTWTPRDTDSEANYKHHMLLSYLSSDLFCREYVTNILLGVLAPKRRSDYMAFQSTWLWFYCYQLYLKLPVLNQYNYYLIDLKSIDSRFRYLWSILAVLVNSYPFVWLLSKNLKWFDHPIVWVYMMKVIS